MRVAVLATAVLAGVAGVPCAVGFGIHAPVQLGGRPCNLRAFAGIPLGAAPRARRCVAVAALGETPSQGSGKGLPARKPVGGEWLSKAMGAQAKDSDYVSKTGTTEFGRFALSVAFAPLSALPLPPLLSPFLRLLPRIFVHHCIGPLGKYPDCSLSPFPCLARQMGHMHKGGQGKRSPSWRASEPGRNICSKPRTWIVMLWGFRRPWGAGRARVKLRGEEAAGQDQGGARAASTRQRCVPVALLFCLYGWMAGYLALKREPRLPALQVEAKLREAGVDIKKAQKPLESCFMATHKEMCNDKPGFASFISG